MIRKRLLIIRRLTLRHGHLSNPKLKGAKVAYKVAKRIEYHESSHPHRSKASVSKPRTLELAVRTHAWGHAA